MFKKFLDGLVFGAGFSITFVTIWFVAYYFVLPGILESRFSSLTDEKVNSIIHEDKTSVLKSAPPIIESNRFLGSMGIYSGDFLDNKSGVLASGPGKIIGKVTANGEAVTGLKLRLALNGSVMSQWATSDENGQYVVHVPYGEYKIDGYELQHSSANKALPGMIGHPQMGHASEEFIVSNESYGSGLDFTFVSPVIKTIPRDRFSISEDVVIKWKPYPGATQYRIQIHEKTDPRGYNMPEQLFEWQHRPVVSDTSLDLSDFYDTKLQSGHFYTIEIDALDDNMNILSKTARNYSGYDFEIIK